MLHEFWATTTTSVYHVFDDAGQGTTQKIALKGSSDISVGHILKDGTMIAICKALIAYSPEAEGMLSPTATFERRIEYVSPAYYGGHSSAIVALFLNEAAARECLAAEDLQPCDPRWITETREVIAAIGEGHPAFEVCHHPDFALLSD